MEFDDHWVHIRGTLGALGMFWIHRGLRDVAVGLLMHELCLECKFLSRVTSIPSRNLGVGGRAAWRFSPTTHEVSSFHWSCSLVGGRSWASESPLSSSILALVAVFVLFLTCLIASPSRNNVHSTYLYIRIHFGSGPTY